MNSQNNDSIAVTATKEGVVVSGILFRIPDGLTAVFVIEKGNKNGTGAPLDPESFLPEDEQKLVVVLRTGTEALDDE